MKNGSSSKRLVSIVLCRDICGECHQHSPRHRFINNALRLALLPFFSFELHRSLSESFLYFPGGVFIMVPIFTSLTLVCLSVISAVQGANTNATAASTDASATTDTSVVASTDSLFSAAASFTSKTSCKCVCRLRMRLDHLC